ncbi:MAG UNVERIFIED_CONTAM: molybdenum cofactor biosynthesis protein MoaE [Anaerolineae bacterium]
MTTPATGAVVTFSGVVRGTTTRQEGTLQTDHLEYEAYHEMAEAKMSQVAKRFGNAGKVCKAWRLSNALANLKWVRTQW